MQRKASFKIFVTRREMLAVGDQLDHTLTLMEMEGEPIDYSPGAAGEFVSRRSVGFHDGFLLITSRASVEMVQKAATVGISSLIAISAPTALAVKTAQAAGMTLIAFARGDEFVAYAHGDRVRGS